MTSRTVYSIASIGAPLAEPLPGTGRWGTVFAVFRRSCYLESLDGQVFCLADSRLGEGPLTMGVEIPSDVTLGDLGVREGCHLESDGVDLRLGRAIVLQTSGMSTWAPELVRKTATPNELLRRINTLMNLVRPLLPSDGLGPIIPHLADLAIGELPTIKLMNAAAQSAVSCISKLSDGLIRLDHESVDQAVSGLVGLGPGLTPSGDDLLAGMLVALLAMPDTASQPSVDLLARCVTRHAAEKTNRISSAMLEQSAKGNGSAAQHRLLRCLLGVDTQPDISRATLELIQVGHTSGWDTLAGILLGIHVSLRMNQDLEVTSAATQEKDGVPA